MARIKKTSRVLTKSRKRLSGLTSISPDLDLGNGLTNVTLRLKIEETELSLEKYNELLSEVDRLQNEYLKSEKELNEFSNRMFNAVAANYGKDSNEYENAGGVRKSEIKHSPKKVKVT
jgi:hypothetical protein